MQNALKPDDRQYFQIPNINQNSESSGHLKNHKFQESTKEFDHFLEAGEQPDIKDLVTNPKYGHKNLKNLIMSQGMGDPVDYHNDEQVISPVTEEWVKDNKIHLEHSDNDLNSDSFEKEDANNRNINYTLSMSNSELSQLPDGFSKQFETDDADINFVLDKSALNPNHNTEEKPCLDDENDNKRTKEYARELITVGSRKRKHRRNRRHMPRKLRRKVSKDNNNWGQLLNSFDSENTNILDEDLTAYNPSAGQLSDSPSEMASQLANLSGNPRSNSQNFLGDNGDSSLKDFMQEGNSGFFEDKEDQNALKEFEQSMNEKSSSRYTQFLI